jgi:hypothetical protein
LLQTLHWRQRLRISRLTMGCPLATLFIVRQLIFFGLMAIRNHDSNAGLRQLDSCGNTAYCMNIEVGDSTMYRESQSHKVVAGVSAGLAMMAGATHA